MEHWVKFYMENSSVHRHIKRKGRHISYVCVLQQWLLAWGSGPNMGLRDKSEQL